MTYNDFSLLSEISFFAEKVFVHRWPHDTPLWNDSIKEQLDDAINKNPEKKQIIINEKFLQIQDFKFSNLKKIGISVPFFKDECRMILEANFGELFTHIHIITKSKDYIEIFKNLKSWKFKFFPNDSNR